MRLQKCRLLEVIKVRIRRFGTLLQAAALWEVGLSPRRTILLVEITATALLCLQARVLRGPGRAV